MCMKVEGRLVYARFIEILQVFAKKKSDTLLSDRYLLSSLIKCLVFEIFHLPADSITWNPVFLLINTPVNEPKFNFLAEDLFAKKKDPL